MKRVLIVCCFFLITAHVFGQQFSQYNTGSLYDSFENPSLRAFIPDTTKNIAFNFLIPTFSANFYVAGNGQEALKTRAFSNYYNTANLETGTGRNNRINLNANIYTLMFKVFKSENGDQEVGLSLNTKTEMRGIASDETISLFNGFTKFPNISYVNILNDNFHYQVYHQISLTYREQVTRKLAVGVKFSALSGLEYREVNINRSSVFFDKVNDEATITMQGTSYVNGTNGFSEAQKALPSFINPGAAISVGTTYVDESGYKWQGNIKDLGFIHWNSRSTISSFAGSTLITGFSTSDRENSIKGGADSLTSGNQVKKSFNTYTNGLLELSINKTYWLDDSKEIKFSPTLIGSKEIFYSGFTAAFVAPVQFNSNTLTLTTSYNDLRMLNLGLQYMIKKDNSEFFIGSERIFQSAALFSDAIHRGSVGSPPPQTVVSQGRYSGMDFFIGASFKFGQLIERRLNSSSIPNGDKGFIGKLWDSIFNKDKNY